MTQKRFYPVQLNGFKVEGVLPLQAIHEQLNRLLAEAGVNDANYNLEDFLRTPDLLNFLVDVGLNNAAVQGYLLDPDKHYDLSPFFGATPLQMFWQHSRWRRHGCPVYDLDERLARAFLDTELRVTGADVRMPLPSFYLAVPHELGLKVWNDATGLHTLDGFYVSLQEHNIDMDRGANGQVTMADGRIGFSSVIPTSESNPYNVPRHFDIPNGLQRSLNVLVCGIPHPGDEVGDDALSHFSIPLSLDVEFEDLLLGSAHLPWERMGENMDLVKTWLRLILNTVMYLCSDDADVQARKFGVSDAVRAEAKKLGGKAGKRLLDSRHNKEIRYSVIGKNLSLDEGTTHHVAGSESERSLTKRFIVRGHWRMHAHGEGRALRKPLWIKPHWKGPAWAEVVAGARVQKMVEA